MLTPEYIASRVVATEYTHGRGMVACYILTDNGFAARGESSESGERGHELAYLSAFHRLCGFLSDELRGKNAG